MRWLSVLLAGLLGFAACAFASEASVSGTASYRERVVLPPGAVFEAVLEAVGPADSPAHELGRATIEDPGAPPFAFEIDYEASEVSPDKTYSVRAQVTVGRRLIFVSDTLNPVLTRGAPDEVEIWMIKVGDTSAEAREAPAAIGAHGLRLPASFTGDLPCDDCEALRYRLNLWPDQVYHLARTREGKGVRRDSIGRWSVDPDAHVLELGGDDPIRLKILGPERLQLLSPDGKPVAAAEEHDLTAHDELRPIEPRLPMRGMLTYVADEARFTECLTGRDYPLVQDGDYEALEHAYLAAGAEAAGPIMASFDGAIMQMPAEDGEGTVPKVLVHRFVGVWPGETCEREVTPPTLTNTYWKILRLGDTEVSTGPDRREPNLVLREGETSYVATVGCNQLVGGYTLAEGRLGFATGARTRMACPPPLGDWEHKLASALEQTAAWRIDGQTLELLDAKREPLALLQAVYLY
jgi:copper homeostasis protein (lipoprotein)